MWSYFKPLRRKIGIVTLMMACVFMGAWIRSLGRTDGLALYFGPVDYILSSDGSLQIEGPSYEWRTDCGMGFEFISEPETRLLKTPSEPEGRLCWGTEWSQFLIGEYNPSSGCSIGGVQSKQYCDWKTWFLGVPYWSIVIPLSALSAYLLLSKPRTTNPKQALER